MKDNFTFNTLTFTIKLKLFDKILAGLFLADVKKTSMFSRYLNNGLSRKR